MVRRQFTREQKLQIVREVLETGSTSMVARRHNIRDSVISRWVRKFKELGGGAFDNARRGVEGRESAEYRALATENERLKRLLGEKDLEIAILRDLVKKRSAVGRKVRASGQVDSGWP
ncbi:MAG TPA: transposase [Firmicutes bacterium]|nr:transposase [Bacillota bacterium]